MAIGKYYWSCAAGRCRLRVLCSEERRGAMDMEEIMTACKLTERCARLEVQRDQLREALESTAYRLELIARVESNYLAESAADKARAALKATEE